MNAPARWELLDQSDEDRRNKIAFKPDSKISNAGTFKVMHEDHTLGNLLYMQLLKDTRVLYAGYKAPHPLEPFIEVKVQTAEGTTPQNAFMVAVEAITRDLSSIENTFNTAVRHHGGVRGNH